MNHQPIFCLIMVVHSIFCHPPPPTRPSSSRSPVLRLLCNECSSKSTTLSRVGSRPHRSSTTERPPSPTTFPTSGNVERSWGFRVERATQKREGVQVKWMQIMCPSHQNAGMSTCRLRCMRSMRSKRNGDFHVGCVEGVWKKPKHPLTICTVPLSLLSFLCRSVLVMLQRCVRYGTY